MTASMSTLIQGVARFNPECRGSLDRSSVFESGYSKNRTKSTVQNMPFTAIFCHISDR